MNEEVEGTLVAELVALVEELPLLVLVEVEDAEELVDVEELVDDWVLELVEVELDDEVGEEDD